MALWSRVAGNDLVLQQMQTFYQSHFPMEVRHSLCHWIEEQQWYQLNETLPEHQLEANSMLQTMVEILQRKIDENEIRDFFVIKFTLEQFIQKVKNIIKVNPFKLVGVIKDCLQLERQLLEQAELAEQQQEELNNVLIAGAELSDASVQIQIVIHNLMQKTKGTESMSKEMQLKQEQFILSFSEGQHINNKLSSLESSATSPGKATKVKELKDEKMKVDQAQNQLASELLQYRITLGKKYEETINALQTLSSQILNDELMSWKHRQQLSGNGFVMCSSNLETLQKLCEDLADLIWQNRQQIKRLIQLRKQLPIKFPPGEYDRVPDLDQNITSLLSTLVTSTFLVEQQPPQVLKKGARFEAAVRLLVGGKLNVHMNPPQVEANIISSSQAKQLLTENFCSKRDRSGDIINNSGTMEYDTSTGQLSAKLRNMTLKKITRNGKKGTEVVTEEKFCILFQSEFRLGGDELIFEVWTLSLPVVVTVHGTQECNATGTVLWDNAFGEPGRLPFVVPDQVKWSQMAEQLNMKFRSSTGKGLSEINQAYIASKLFDNRDPSLCHVTWSQFNREHLSGTQFTFWEWFYSIEKLTKEHLKDLWIDDAIIGFLSKEQATSLLFSQKPGTFLLRFSNSKNGGISIAWLEGNEVQHLAPSSSKDFLFRGLADRIKDMDELIWLYPNKHKNEIFSKYYTHNTGSYNVNEDGYIEPEMKSTIPRKPNSSSPEQSLSSAFSPQSMLSSPGSAFTATTDFDERIPITPLAESMGDMELNSITDYMPDDIGAAGLDLGGIEMDEDNEFWQSDIGLQA